jgi:hypothetical protein
VKTIKIDTFLQLVNDDDLTLQFTDDRNEHYTELQVLSIKQNTNVKFLKKFHNFFFCIVPRKHSQLSLVPTSPPSIYSQQSPTIPVGTPPSLQLTTSPARVSAPDLKSGKPPNIPMSGKWFLI